MPDNIRITVTRSAGADNAVLVLIDTTFEPDGSDNGPGLRVLINDWPTYAGVSHEPTNHGRGVVPDRTLDVNLREIEYEHPHNTGDYSDDN